MSMTMNMPNGTSPQGREDKMVILLTLYVQGSDHCRQARSYVLDEMAVPIMYNDNENLNATLGDAASNMAVFRMFKKDSEDNAIRRGIRQLEFKWRNLLDKLYNVSEKTTEISYNYGDSGRNFYMMRGDVVSAVIELERTTMPASEIIHRATDDSTKKIGDIFGALDAEELEKKLHMEIEWGIIR